MKVFAAALALLLLVASSQTFSGPAGADVPTCCVKFTRQKLPRNRILRHYSTSSSCPQPGILFITIRDQKVCAKLTDTWVQRYLQSLEQN